MPPVILEVGPLDSAHDMYPVTVVGEDLSGGVAETVLGPLLHLPIEELLSKRFIHFQIEKLDRVKITIADQDLLFSPQEIKSLLSELSHFKYVKTLTANEKSALMFDPGEVNLVIYFYRKDADMAFMELKFYRRDFVYLEMNSSPPLYVLPSNSLSSFQRFLIPLLHEDSLNETNSSS